MFIISISDILNTIQLRGRVYQIKKKKKKRITAFFTIGDCEVYVHTAMGMYYGHLDLKRLHL